MTPYIIAIDPGKSGGIAVRFPDRKVRAFKMPDTEGDVVEFFQGIRDEVFAEQGDGSEVVVVLEEQRGFFQGKERPGSNMFKYGKGYGILIGTIMTLGWRLELVLPKKWQQALSLGAKSTHPTDNAWKNHLKARAQQLYPHIKVILDTADALLILEYKLRQG